MDLEDFRAWLARHGASTNVTDSPPVIGLYDLGFAYPQGRQNIEAGRAAAGVAVRALLRMFADYRGAPLWRMSAGMGDTVFAPAWDVLGARGVNLRLFHHVLGVSAQRGRVLNVRVGVQALGLEDYDPLIDVGSVRAWPERPIESRLSDLAPGALDGDHSKTLRELELCHGRDFDIVVMAIPAAGQRHCATGLAEANPRYGAMREACHTIPTVAAQVWMSRSAEVLGADARPTVSTGHPGLFRTHANMTDVLGGPRPGAKLPVTSPTSAGRRLPKFSLPPDGTKPTLVFANSPRRGSVPRLPPPGPALRPLPATSTKAPCTSTPVLATKTPSTCEPIPKPGSATSSPFPARQRIAWRPTTPGSTISPLQATGLATRSTAAASRRRSRRG